MNLTDHAWRWVRPLPVGSLYTARLSEELRVIDQCGFWPVLEQAALLAKVLREAPSIPFFVRGSAGSSLVCYLMGISEFDPVAEGIAMTRFLNPLRPSPPDIDFDLPHIRRAEGLSRFRKALGGEPNGVNPGRVGLVSAVWHYGERSALREALRRVAGYRGRLPVVVNERVLTRLVGEEALPQVAAEWKRLVGTPGGYLRHPGGVVVFEREVPKAYLLPDQRGREGQMTLDRKDCEKAGYYKLDILSNRSLSVLLAIDPRPLADYPETDAATELMLGVGATLGVCHAESPAMRRMLRLMQPRSRTELALCLGLVRPAANHWRNNTLGLGPNQLKQAGVVFEDDATAYLGQLLDLDPERADWLRRGFAKGETAAVDFFKKVFRGTEVEQRQLLERLATLEEYSFCKAHALAYARVAWALAYHKAHCHPLFWQAVLQHAMPVYAFWVHVEAAKDAGWRFVSSGRRVVEWSVVSPGVLGPSDYVPDLFGGLAPDLFREFARLGYWSGSKFYPGCFEDREWRGSRCWVRFRGLIATVRHFALAKSPGSCVSFVTVSTGRGTTSKLRFLDVYVSQLVREGVCLAGEGWLEDPLGVSPVVRVASWSTSV